MLSNLTKTGRAHSFTNSSLYTNKLGQKLLLFPHKNTLFLPLNSSKLTSCNTLFHSIINYCTLPKSGQLFVTLWCTNLIVPPMILKESCLQHFSALTKSVTVNKSKPVLWQSLTSSRPMLCSWIIQSREKDRNHPINYSLQIILPDLVSISD